MGYRSLLMLVLGLVVAVGAVGYFLRSHSTPPERPPNPAEIETLKGEQVKLRQQIRALTEQAQAAEQRAKGWQDRARVAEGTARMLGERIGELQQARQRARSLTTVEEKWSELRRLLP